MHFSLFIRKKKSLQKFHQQLAIFSKSHKNGLWTISLKLKVYHAMFINKSYDLYNLAYFAFELKNKSLRPFYQNGVSMDPKKVFGL